MTAREVVDEGAVAGVAGQGTASGLAGEQGFAENLIDEEPVVVKEGEDRRVQRLLEGEDETARDGRHEDWNVGNVAKTVRKGGES